MEPLRIFDNFKLDDLDEDWINSVWDGEFLTFKKVPDNYIDHINSEDMDILLHDCSTIIKDWINANERNNTDENLSETTEEVSWQTLISLNVNPRNLLPVLGQIIKTGNSFDANEDARQSCLKSSNLYFALLSVPGSNAFHVFHPNLYNLALTTLKLSERLVNKRQRSIADIDLAELYEPENETMITTEKLTLNKGLNSLMFNVITMLKSFHFRDQPRSLEITVHSLLQVAKLAREIISFNKDPRPNEASINSLSYNAYIALHLLCNSNHGPVDVTIKLIAKYLLPNLVSNQDELTTKELSAIRETMNNFLRKLLDAHRKEAHLGVSTLIQNLMIKCPERADARAKQVPIILRLINSCDKDMFNKAIGDLIALSHHSKVNLRIFAQDIIGKFLMANFSNGNDDENENLNVKKLLVATVLSRCVDSSSLVRGKALTIIVDCTDPENNIASTIIKDIFEGENPDKPLPSFQTLQEAVFEDDNPLPGSNTIISILSSRVNDERAITRGNALKALGNLVQIFSGLLNTFIPTLGEHCRDPTMMVRSYSVQIFTKLVEKFPEHPLLPQEWVRHVLPQIFDMEVKVQEKVLEALQLLLLNNITYFINDDRNSDTDLPWTILSQITEQKMRKHLTKASAVWVTTKQVTDSMIAKIKSHIGTRNNIPAWVLLAAIAKYENLPDMNVHFQKYKEILGQNTFEANLIVEVMRNSWTTLEQSFLETLQPDLFERLSEFQVNFSLVSVCCDLFTEVTKHLNEGDGDEIVKLNALDLMKLSEAQLEKFVDHEDNGEESLQIYLKAMITLGHASHLCTGSISQSTLRVLQGIVVEWDSLPEAVRYLSELRAAAVTVLGQQAMRDREDAQEILPVLGYLIRTSTAPNSRVQPAVKVNAAKALADICIRYTALVEPYLPDMCVSMKDEDPVIREAIVVLFIQLLLEDFIKVKGPFFFHILTMLNDTDEMVRDLTIFLIKERLLVKNKTLIFRQFLESIFHFNNYKFPNKFSSTKVSQRETPALTLPGQRNFAQRKIIYNFMIEHLEPVEKLKIITRLTSEIISSVICGTIDVQKEEGLSVLKDCLHILSIEELQSSSSGKRNDDDCQDENPLTENLPANSVANAISNDLKKHRIEVLIPALVKLKRNLNKIASPFADHVARYYLKIVKDYKREQLASIYSEHPNLEKEIERDLNKYRKSIVDDDQQDLEQILVQRSSSQASHARIAHDRMPRIVLRRISSLTYPGKNIWRSPSQSSQSDGQSSQFECSNSQISMTSPNRLSELSSPPPSSLPGPSNSTPTTSKSRQLRHSPRFSPIYNQSYYLSKNPSPKRKGASIISHHGEDYEEENIPRLSEIIQASRRKKVARKLRSSTDESSTEIDGTENRLIETESDSD